VRLIFAVQVDLCCLIPYPYFIRGYLLEALESGRNEIAVHCGSSRSASTREVLHVKYEGGTTEYECSYCETASAVLVL